MSRRAASGESNFCPTTQQLCTSMIGRGGGMTERRSLPCVKCQVSRSRISGACVRPWENHVIANNSVIILGQTHATGRCRRRFAFTLVGAFVSKVGETKAYARVCPSSGRESPTGGPLLKAFPSVAAHRLFPLNQHHWVAKEALLSCPIPMITTFLLRVYIILSNLVGYTGMH